MQQQQVVNSMLQQLPQQQRSQIEQARLVGCQGLGFRVCCLGFRGLGV